MQIRDERTEDIEAISLLQKAAFTGHPQHAPGAEPTEHRIVERLRASGALSLSLLAEEGGELMGHIAFSPVTIKTENEAARGWFLLGPVGVTPARQRQGIGSALVAAGLERLRAAGAAGVVLVGDPGFYGRFGFASVPGLGWPGVPERYVLALGFAGETPQGDIACHEAFGCGAG